eukprot:CAMPEP_0196768720 /NCGR_PEP_ID=MMETSP1104-20130614/57_1 /TAXON_ID=33652 /ORGANISM="Cafeteria sp., Strain Caron Lab Isolate" /LENGTH=34 /DNA_ID= /DNA_START= /DNA_END= /DNA_ORIENTATION=
MATTFGGGVVVGADQRTSTESYMMTQAISDNVAF